MEEKRKEVIEDGLELIYDTISEFKNGLISLDEAADKCNLSIEEFEQLLASDFDTNEGVIINQDNDDLFDIEEDIDEIQKPIVNKEDLTEEMVLDKITEKTNEDFKQEEDLDEFVIKENQDELLDEVHTETIVHTPPFSDTRDFEMYTPRAGDRLDAGDVYIKSKAMSTIGDVNTDDEERFLDNGLSETKTYREPSYTAPIHTYEYEEDKGPWYASKYALIAAVAAVVALSMFLGWIFLNLFGINNKSNNNSITPNQNNITPSQEVYVYEGKDVSVGKAYGESQGYTVYVVEQYSDIATKGTIMSSHLENKNGKQELTLYVSLGSENNVNPNGSSTDNNSDSSNNNTDDDSSESSSSRVNRVIIPVRLRYMNQEEAEKELKGLKLNYTVKQEYSNSVNEGNVLSTYPSLGTTVDEGSAVTLNISRGKPVVGNHEGRSVAELLTEIERLNESGAQLTLNTVQQSSDKTKNIILRQDKVGRVEIGGTVTATISSGEDLSNKSFVGRTLSEFRDFANEHGFPYEHSERYSDTIPNGIIISQSPTDFTNFSGTAHAIVSLGKYHLPDMRGRTTSEFEYELADAYNKGQTLYYRYIEEYNSNVGEGRIISTSMDNGVIIARVSLGPERRSYIESQIGKSVQEVQDSEICRKYNCSFVKETDSSEVEPGHTRITSSPEGMYAPGDYIEFRYIRGIKKS